MTAVTFSIVSDDEDDLCVINHMKHLRLRILCLYFCVYVFIWCFIKLWHTTLVNFLFIMSVYSIYFTHLINNHWWRWWWWWLCQLAWVNQGFSLFGWTCYSLYDCLTQFFLHLSSHDLLDPHFSTCN